MDFLQAKRKLKKLAKGKYHTVRYEVTEFSDRGGLSQTCTLYIDGHNFEYGANWEQAFKGMVQQVNPQEIKPVVIEAIKEVVKVK